MSYDSLEVARYIINYCYEKKQAITNLKLQKILYYAWIDYFKQTKKELFYDNMCAWQFGPVVPGVYYEFCSYAGVPINKAFCADIEENDAGIINVIINKYIGFTASKLVDMSHKPGLPWNLIYKNGFGLRDVIPFSLIKHLECNC